MSLDPSFQRQDGDNFRNSEIGGKRAYFGRVDQHLIQVKFVYDHLFLIRPYRAASVSWRFNCEGRLELMDSKKLRVPRHACNNISHILKVEKIDFLPKDFATAEVLLGNMPDEVIYSINSDFASLTREERFAKLVEYGHCEANYLLHRIHSGLFPPRFELSRERNQFSLPEIRDDSAAMDIIRKSAGLKPQLVIEQFPYAEIFY